jgi:hypothetical protein
MGRSDERKSEIHRRKVRELLISGKSVAAIAKATGKTYKHTARIVEQERGHCIEQMAKGQTP